MYLGEQTMITSSGIRHVTQQSRVSWEWKEGDGDGQPE